MSVNYVLSSRKSHQFYEHVFFFFMSQMQNVYILRLLEKPSEIRNVNTLCKLSSAVPLAESTIAD